MRSVTQLGLDTISRGARQSGTRMLPVRFGSVGSRRGLRRHRRRLPDLSRNGNACFAFQDRMPFVQSCRSGLDVGREGSVKR